MLGSGSVAGVFQFPALVADVPQVAIAAVNLLPACGDRKFRASRRSRDSLRATSESHSRQGAMTFSSRSQRLVRQFEADLIVALSGAAVRHRSRTLAERHFHLMFGNHRTRQRSAQQILVFVHRACPQCGEHVIR